MVLCMSGLDPEVSAGVSMQLMQASSRPCCPPCMGCLPASGPRRAPRAHTGEVFACSSCAGPYRSRLRLLTPKPQELEALIKSAHRPNYTCQVGGRQVSSLCLQAAHPAGWQTGGRSIA